MKTRSAKRGASTSAVEVTNVSPQGVWLLLDETERFLSFRDFPWFEHATIGAIANVERPSPAHLHWPALDVDLAVASIDSPGAFPLVGRARKRRAAKRASRRRA